MIIGRGYWILDTGCWILVVLLTRFCLILPDFKKVTNEKASIIAKDFSCSGDGFSRMYCSG